MTAAIAEILLHPTVKPVALIADAIKDVSRRGGIVLDLFGGSGSTLIAAHKTGRRAYLCELDPLYCDRIVRRWQTYAKDDAIHEASGRTFDEMQQSAEMPNRQTKSIYGASCTSGNTSALYNHTTANNTVQSEFVTEDENLLVCWLPRFHPVLATSNANDAGEAEESRAAGLTTTGDEKVQTPDSRRAMSTSLRAAE